MTENTSVKDKAAQSGQAGKDAASDLASTATEQAHNVAGEAQKQARDLVGEAREQVRSQVGEQHRSAVTNLRSLGDELDSMSQQSNEGGVATDLVSRAAGHAHEVANWLDGRDPQDVLEEVRRFARRRPGTFLLGALAAGVVAGRLTRGTVAAHQNSGSGTDSTPSRPLPSHDGGQPISGYTDSASVASPSIGSTSVDDGYAPPVAPLTPPLADEPARHAAGQDAQAVPGYGYPAGGVR